MSDNKQGESVANDPAPEPQKRPAPRKSDLTAKPKSTSNTIKVTKTVGTTPKGSSKVAPVSASSTAAVGSSSSQSSPTERDWRRLSVRIGGAVVAVVVVLLILFGVLIYQFQNSSSVVKAVAAVVPYPVESVNGHWVTYNDYLFELDTYKSYLSSKSTGQTPIDFSSASGKQQLEQVKKQVMTELKSDEVVRELAATDKVTVTSAQINNEVNALTQQAGGAAKLKEVLSSVYGWNMNDLKRKLSFQLLQQQLQTKLQSDPTLEAAAKAKAQDVLNQINAGGDFATLAKKYSQDSATASNGGELGAVGSNSGLDPIFTKTALSLQPGQVSAVTKTSDGYEIIKVNSKTGDQVDVSHILIEPLDFTTYLNQQVSKAKTTVFLKV